MRTKNLISLNKILDLNLEKSLDIVDIGASYIESEGESVYLDLLKSGLANVIGFEPNLKALEILNQRKKYDELYLPYAVGDGNEYTLNLCEASGMTSLLEPNYELLSYFHGFTSWAKIYNKIIVQTKRIDDIDFLKLDIQGAELLVLKNSENKLKNCMVIQTEVEFLPMYKEQPLFSDVELFLRKHGFILHTFHNISKRFVAPLANPNNVFDGLNQFFWADAIFIKDFTKLELFSKEKLLKYCVLLHDIYKSFDLVLRTLHFVDERFKTNYYDKYLKVLMS